MVVNRGDIKRKRKDDPCFSLLDENPKRTKVHAQRKFAQGSNVSSPVITPVKEIERQERNKDVLPEPIELLPMKRPNTEDFLTFLCFRGTPILPPNLNFFNATSMADLQVKNSEPKPTYHKNGPILTTSANKSQNEKPFVAFGVRKRADPIVISKQMDRKRRHALALQALRRKYQEQKMAKIRAVTISKLSEKSVVRTRSVTKNEIACKKPTPAQKTEVKIQVATKQITTTKTSAIKQPIKSKMCLRSFRGRYIHKELNVKTHKKRPPNKAPVKQPPLKTSTPKSKIETEKSSSEFSSDDDEPLIKTRAVKKMASSSNPVKKHRRTIESSVRLTRSHNKLGNKLQTQQRKQQTHLKHHRRIITRLSTGTVKNKIVQSSSIIRNLRRSVNTMTRRRNQNVPQKVIRATKQRIFKNKVEKKSGGDVGNIAQTRSRAADNANNKVVLNAKEIACKKEELGHDDVCKRRSGNINKSVKLEKPVVKECNTTKKDVKIIKDNKIAGKNLSVRIEQNKRINRLSPVQTKKKSPTSTLDKAQKPKQSPRSPSSSSAESIEEEQEDTKTKDVNTENTMRRRSIPNKKKIMGEKVLEISAAGRPSRKTKEAAAIYMELLGHKLVNSSVVDDEDDESIVSFPELPNVRKTEQRENELKARVSKSKSNVDQDEVNVKEDGGTSHANVAKKAVDKTKLKAIVVAGDSAEIIVLEKSKNKGKIAAGESRKHVERDKNEVQDKNELQEKNSPKKVDAVPIVKEVEAAAAKEEKSIGAKRKGESKAASKEVIQNAGVPKAIVSRQQRSVTESDIDNAMASMFPPNHLVTYNDPERDSIKGSANGDLAKTNADQSFSDSDEEPLSNLTKSKDKTMGSEEGRDLARKKEKLCEDKPKRDISPKKKPHNYLPFSSSDDEEKYFHGFVKTELKTLKQLTVVIAEQSDDTIVKKCPQHSLPSSDLSCKDVSRRYGKGKVNMSNEQIEKWLNDSAMAAKKEDDDMMLKYAEEDEKLSSPVVEDVPRLKLDTSEGKMDAVVAPANAGSEEKDFKAIIGARENEESCSLNSSTPEKGTGADVDNRTTPKSTPSERKTIFRKEKTGPVRNAHAFSASNECSVYAFEADNEDSSVSTPFRRPCRRPSSTATSKSEDDSKAEDLSKYPGKFRFPAALRSDPKTTIKQQTAQTSQDDSSTNEANVDLQADTSNSEDAEQRSSATQKKKYIPPESRCNRSTTLINKTTTNTKAITKAKPVVSSQPNDKSMFPPSNTVLQKGNKCGEQKHSTHKTATGNNHRSVLETFEDAKYKIPSSPSASSSSSAKLASKRQPAKARHSRLMADICTPVNVAEFPGCDAPQSRIVEAPAFRPSEREFQDPLEYIEKIRAKAEKFGICRIIPPANFKPECKVSDDMRFTAYNQYVHKMLHRWGPNFKELMAIRKYLETQNITLTHPPWIGGMEIDLPRLYQTVQSLGGLKEVIEKKKWPKVSEMMKIPKSAQDRVTKLDDIYCKYLLPYDTLSPAEREKLFDEVETEWAKRESKTLLKVQRLNKVDSSSGTDADSDSDNESEECIVKGRNIALNAFYRIARNTMSMWFRASEPSAEEVEQEFWRHVTHKNSHICVHSGSIDSGNWGYGFAVSKNSPFARHAWNLKVLTNNSGSVLRSMGPVMGVTVPTLHVGMVFSACCWYRDPHRLPWIEYLHTGAHKIWYGIPDSMSERFHDTMRKLVPNYCRNKSIWLPSDTVMVPPKLLVENGVSLCRTVQEPGQFVVVFPKVFTSSVSTGYVVSESVYFAPAHWLRSAPNVFDELRNNCEPSMFSIDRLLLSITSDARSSVDVLNQVVPAIRELCERERRLRDRLRELGLKLTEKLPPPEVPAVRKRRKLLQHESAGDYECEICSANLFLSLVTEYQEDVVYCLEHVIEYIQEKRIDVKNCKLLYTYECQELDLLLDKIKSAIETKQQKKTLSSKVGLSLVK